MLEGLNSGVPTKTTPTLTPTTLRNIQETFINVDESQHTHQAGFVPPVVPNQGFYTMDVVNKSWSGGRSTRMPEAHTPLSFDLLKQPSSPSPAATRPRRNVGGRRPNKDANISAEEEEKRQVRRERNKMAAARCRKRRLDHTNELLLETDGLEGKKQELQNEIQKLQQYKNELELLLEAHKPSCRLLSHHHQPASPPDIKPIIADDEPDLVIADQGVVPPPYPAEKKPHLYARPTTLLVPPFQLGGGNQGPGVPLTTPTAGIPFNFDSLMEGGTGLTPVSGPLIPSCSSQQRNNSGCPDLASPDSTKLVSL